MRFAVMGLAIIAAFPTAIEAQDGPSAAKQARAEAVLKATPNGSVSWDLPGDGSLRHKTSGLACPAEVMPSMALSEVSSAPNGRALCTYFGSPNKAEQFEVFATPANGDTVETAFKAQRDALLTANKGASLLAPLQSERVPASRAEVFTTTSEDGKPALTYLFTVVVKDWVVSSRFRYPVPTPSLISVQIFGAFAQADFADVAEAVERAAKTQPKP